MPWGILAAVPTNSGERRGNKLYHYFALQPTRHGKEPKKPGITGIPGLLVAHCGARLWGQSAVSVNLCGLTAHGA